MRKALGRARPSGGASSQEGQHRPLPSGPSAAISLSAQGPPIKRFPRAPGVIRAFLLRAARGKCCARQCRQRHAELAVPPVQIARCCLLLLSGLLHIPYPRISPGLLWHGRLCGAKDWRFSPVSGRGPGGAGGCVVAAWQALRRCWPHNHLPLRESCSARWGWIPREVAVYTTKPVL